MRGPLAAPPISHRQDIGWRQRQSGRKDGERLARALGWFSIGLGLAQLAAPRGVARLIGVNDSRGIMSLVGVREIVCGVGLLARPKPTGWAWARIGGDVMDLALLGTALSSDRARRDRVVAAMTVAAGVTILDLLCAQQLSQQSGMTARHVLAGRLAIARQDRTIRVKKAITVNGPADELYGFWRNLENLPRIMRHLDAVQVIDERRSHWTAKAPFGRTVEWDAEITEDRPNERIAWRSVDGADVDNAGAVTFKRAPGDRGTVVRVELEYDPPGGVIGATIAKLFGEEPGQQVQEDLRAFKQVMEIGEIVQSEAMVRGGGPAQPSPG